MTEILLILLMINLLGIAYQDCTQRKVALYTLLLLGILSLVSRISICSNYLQVAQEGSINVLCMLIMYTILYGYTRLRGLSLSESIGKGDILFFLFLAFAFPPLLWMAFFLVGSIFTLLLHFTIRYQLQVDTRTAIPYAGYFSVFLIVMYIGLYTSNNMEYLCTENNYEIWKI